MLAFLANTTNVPRSSEIVIIDLQTSETTVYTPKAGSENTSPKWHPKTRRILFKTNAAGPYDLPSTMWIQGLSQPWVFLNTAWTSLIMDGLQTVVVSGL
ncbi:MAG: hypothetical protein QXJ09_08035 [Candidatus Caldarchaeum sp.]